MSRSPDGLELAFLVQLALGTAALVGGVLRARVSWRSDVQPYGRATRLVDVLVHPERYAAEDSLRGIRILNLCGAALLAGAVCVLAWQAVLDVLGRLP